MTNSVAEMTISELFTSGRYVIPIYQRNYAWGEQEVKQLLQDVYDYATANKASNYYIGSLVVDKREENEFETIDGQQRHTTLTIILAALKNNFSYQLDDGFCLNLCFDSRPLSGATLSALYEGHKLDTEEPVIRAAYNAACQFFSDKSQEEINNFAQYLLNHVIVLRTVVPEKTDLNHYFEIMNNRGEQLEKHEILKARFMEKLCTDGDRVIFSLVWDACSDMNKYVHLSFTHKQREKVFASDYLSVPESFEQLEKAIYFETEPETSFSLYEIIKKPEFKQKKDAPASQGDEKFTSVINFPNFLLHTLRIMYRKDVRLDDKQLLDIFDRYNPNPKHFLAKLLKLRTLFDRFVIKRESEERWSLFSITYYNENKNYGYINSITEGNKMHKSNNRTAVMLLSMFHVSFPAQVYKHWLSAVLNYLDNNEIETIQANYVAELERLCDAFFFGRFCKGEPIDYFDLTFKPFDSEREFDKDYLNQGTGVQNFLFNRLDYCLWRENIASNEPLSDISKQFEFTFRSSVEHYYPQNPIAGERLIASDTIAQGVDTFGNLCLISNSKNSRLSNHLPDAKKDFYKTAKTADSLKQHAMMNYQHWGPETPEGLKNIMEHEEKMVELLEQPLIN